jgi:ketosteroid isomerase-like protein
MSEENVAALRQAIDAFAAKDLERVLEFMDPEIRFDGHLAAFQGVFEGHDGVRQFWTDAFENMDVLGVAHKETRDLGERALALGSFKIGGRASGIETEVPFAILARFRKGRIVDLKDYGEAMPALEAAGLSE